MINFHEEYNKYITLFNKSVNEKEYCGLRDPVSYEDFEKRFKGAYENAPEDKKPFMSIKSKEDWYRETDGDRDWYYFDIKISLETNHKAYEDFLRQKESNEEEQHFVEYLNQRTEPTGINKWTREDLQSKGDILWFEQCATDVINDYEDWKKEKCYETKTNILLCEKILLNDFRDEGRER